MSDRNRVVWEEGMFLRPQHFQQQDRFLLDQIASRADRLQPFDWGFSELTVERGPLAEGAIALSLARGRFRDGTPFDLPDVDSLPAPLAVDSDVRNQFVVLATPVVTPGGSVEFGPNGPGAAPNGGARYGLDERDVNDAAPARADQPPVPVRVGRLSTQLKLEREAAEGFSSLRVARVIERRSDGQLILDAGFIAPCLDYRVSPQITAFLHDFPTALRQRAQELAQRVSPSNQSTTGDIEDYLMLMALNRYQPWLKHLADVAGLHPRHCFEVFVQAAGELSTHTRREDRLPVEMPAYDHDALDTCFAPLMEELYRLLSGIREPNAVQIALDHIAQYNIWRGQITDHSLLSNASFYLVVTAEVGARQLAGNFPNQVTIAEQQAIRGLIQAVLPGVPVRVLPVMPRQLRHKTRAVYLELDRSNEHWKTLASAPSPVGIALQVSGNYPGLEMELWAVRE